MEVMNLIEINLHEKYFTKESAERDWFKQYFTKI